MAASKVASVDAAVAAALSEPNGVFRLKKSSEGFSGWKIRSTGRKKIGFAHFY